MNYLLFRFFLKNIFIASYRELGLLFLSTIGLLVLELGAFALFAKLLDLLDPSNANGSSSVLRFDLPTLAVFSAVILLASACYRVVHQFLIARMSAIVGSRFAGEVLNKRIDRYGVSFEINVGETVNSVKVRTDVLINNFILPISNIISNFFILTGAFIFILFWYGQIYLAAILLVAAMFMMTIFGLRPALLRISAEKDAAAKDIFSFLTAVARDSAYLYFRGVSREIQEKYAWIDFQYRWREGLVGALAASPKFVIEGIVGAALCGFIYIASMDFAELDLGALLGFGFVLIRCLPYVQAVNQGISVILGNKKSIERLVEEISSSKHTYVDGDKTKRNLDGIRFESGNSDASQNQDFLSALNSITGPTCIIGKSGVGKSFALKSYLNIIKLETHDRHSISISTPEDKLLGDSVLESMMQANNDTSLADIVGVINALMIFDSETQLTEEFLRNSRIELLSSGQRRRLSVARCVLDNADIYVFDEPDSGLDSLTADTVMRFLIEVMRDKRCIIVSHNKEAQYLFNVAWRIV